MRSPAAPGDGGPVAHRLQRRIVEIDTAAEFDDVARRSTSMAGWRVRHVDLTSRTDALLRLDPAGALLLGCRIEPASAAHLHAGGALVFPDVPGSPVDEYRTTLYSAAELYDGIDELGYEGTLDAEIYAWSQGLTSDPLAVAARALHDSSVVAALDVAVAAKAASGRRVVGVMGGHAAVRGSGPFADAARLGRSLAQEGFVVATGGGPGAMEAANLGAALSGYRTADLEAALDLLAATPSFRPSVTAWVAAALGVLDRWPDGSATLAAPTWFYGHEPSNVFATGIAKLFQNSVREATLLERCTGGVVFLPGAAGTVQEVFQDACENYYADPALVAPMVFVGEHHWTVDVPVWPLISALAEVGGFVDAIALVDDSHAAVAHLGRFGNA